MTISIIVAVASNRAIGKDNQLLWHMPADMKFFKEKTLGHPVISGRKNFLSIPEKYRPLSGRTNIIVTNDKSFIYDGIIICYSIEEAIELAKKENKEVFIIGGGQIYKYALQNNLCNKMYVTEIHHEFEADVFFPEVNLDLWIEMDRKDYNADEKNPYNFSFVTYNLK